MKKYLHLIIAAFFFIFSFAGTTIIIHTGSTVASGGGGDTYLFQYNGDHASGTTYASINSGASSASGSTNSMTISSAQNHTSGGTYSAFADNSNSYIQWTSGVSGYVNTSEFSIEAWIYFNAASATGDNSFFEVFGTDTSDFIKLLVNSSGNVVAIHRASGSNQTSVTSSDTITTQAWQRIRVRGSVTSDILSVQIGTGSWADDADSDAMTAWTTSINEFTIGEDLTYGIADGLYIDDLESIDGYNTFND